METEKRKAEHLKIALTKNVQFKKKTTGFEDIELIYRALPESNLEEIDLKTEFLGKKFKAPVMIAGMTGGIKEAERINLDIAIACQETGIGMGLGSMRAMIEEKSLAYTYQVRDVAPDIFLAGNLGVTQLKKFSVKETEKALKEIKADAIAIHLNPAQEAMQYEGNKNFLGSFKTLKEFAEGTKFPVYAKEVGHGISYETAKMLDQTAIKAVDVGGAGGTSWVAIDSLRGYEELGKTYWDWGIPTAVSIIETRKALSKEKKVIATGGIRTGLDAVKAIILGADLVGIGLPALKEQNERGSKGVKALIERIIEEMKIGMFLIGAKNLAELKEKKFVIRGKTREWLEQRKY